MLKFRQVLKETIDDPHVVVNSKTQQVVGKYKNAKTARLARDKADIKYGAAIHVAKRVENKQ
jgi:hypothetical protein